MHYVYILESQREPNQHYVGYTTDLHQRLTDRNAGKSSHTSKHRPWNLVCYHAFADEKRATAFEAYRKTGFGREFRRRHFGA